MVYYKSYSFPKQLFFQNPFSPTMEGIVVVHNDIMVVMLSIFFSFIFLFFYLLYKETISNKNSNLSNVINRKDQSSRSFPSFPSGSPRPPKKNWKEKLKEHLNSFFFYYICGFFIIIIFCFLYYYQPVPSINDKTEFFNTLAKLLYQENKFPISFKAYILSVYESSDFFYFDKFIETTALDRRNINFKVQFLIEIIAIYNDKYNLLEDSNKLDLFISMLLKYCIKYELPYTSNDLLTILYGLDHLNQYIYYKTFIN